MVNALNDGGPRALVGYATAPPYLDVSRDLLLTTLDALLVINRINADAAQQLARMGEGERGVAAAAGSSGAVSPGAVAYASPLAYVAPRAAAPAAASGTARVDAVFAEAGQADFVGPRQVPDPVRDGSIAAKHRHDEEAALLPLDVDAVWASL